MRPPREVREGFSPGESSRGGIHLDSSKGRVNGSIWGLIPGLVSQVVWYLSFCFSVLSLFLH